MEHALVAPYAGVVRDLDANVGDQVEMDDRIMWIEKKGEGEGPAKGK
jgi:biotin carboxyl carrier protein